MRRGLALVKAALWGLLVLAVLVRVASWLLAPAIPLLIVLFCGVSLLAFIVIGPNRRI